MYAFEAALICDDCGRAEKERQEAAGTAPDFPQAERTFDSDDYPKYADEDSSDTDSLSACDHCGVLIPEGLTAEGTRGMAETLAEFIVTGYGNRPWLEAVMDHLETLSFEPDEYDGATLLTLARDRARRERADEAAMLRRMQWPSAFEVATALEAGPVTFPYSGPGDPVLVAHVKVTLDEARRWRRDGTVAKGPDDEAIETAMRMYLHGE